MPAFFSILTPLFLPPSSDSLSYFILAVPMRKCLGKYSCISSPFPIAILNGTFFFLSVKAMNNWKRSSIKQILLLLLTTNVKFDDYFRFIQIESGCKSTDIPIFPPPTELPPKPWWDSEADRCLLLGVYKHGYDRYSVMRNDPSLCFLARCGPPDKASLQAEMTITM